MRLVCYQIEIFNKETEIILKASDRNSGVEKYNNWNKNSAKELNSRFEKEEERVAKLEDRMEIAQRDAESRGKIKKWTLRDPWIPQVYKHMLDGSSWRKKDKNRKDI